MGPNDLFVTTPRGRMTVRQWGNPRARYLALLLAEEITGDALQQGGAVVYKPLLLDGTTDDLVADARRVVKLARAVHRDLPLAIVGDAVAARYAELHPDEASVVATADGDVAAFIDARLPTAAAAPPAAPAAIPDAFHGGWGVSIERPRDA